MADPSDYMKDPRAPTQTQLSTSLPGQYTFITGHNTDSGESIIAEKREARWDHFDDKQFAMSTIYVHPFHSDLNGDKDLKHNDDTIAGGKLGLVHPKGTVIRRLDLAPLGESLMHRTKSLDYGIIIEGSVELLLDDGSKSLLRRGDVAVQRATMHAWRNPSETEWTRIVFVLQDIEALSIKGQRLGEDFGGKGEGINPSGND